MQSVKYLVADRVDDALQFLDTYGEDAKVVAGSTAVTLMLRQGLIEPRVLVDVHRLNELRQISDDGEYISIGALCTHQHVALHPLIQQYFPALATAFRSVGNIRVRNAATAGGVIAEADYASDPPTAAIGYGAEATMMRVDGSRSDAVANIITGFYETTIQPNELLTSLRIPKPKINHYAQYIKYSSRTNADRPCVGVYAGATWEPEARRFTDLQIAIGAATERPWQCPEIVDMYPSLSMTAGEIREIAIKHADAIDPIADIRGSARYRSTMIRVHIERVLSGLREKAMDR